MSSIANISEASRPVVAQVALTISLSLIMMLAISGNLLIFVAISRASYLRSQVGIVFIANLAVTDLGCAGE